MKIEIQERTPTYFKGLKIGDLFMSHGNLYIKVTEEEYPHLPIVNAYQVGKNRAYKNHFTDNREVVPIKELIIRT